MVHEIHANPIGVCGHHHCFPVVTLVGANTNPAEMHVMKNEIIKPTRMVNENITSSKIGEFEKHTKGFGSSYMMKYGFVKGKGLGKNA